MTWTTGRKITVRIILEDGTPQGIRKVTASSWNGVAIVCPRAHFPHARTLPEFGRPGVYVLVGEDEKDPDTPKLYIGEADDLATRLEQHYRKKEWWGRLIAFSSQDEFFNKAHAQHVESRLVGLAMQAKRATIDNGNQPQKPRISEADEADSERFIDHVLMLLPILGVDGLEVRIEQPRPQPLKASDSGDLQIPVQEPTPSEASHLYLRSRGADARGRVLPDGFLVYAGATGRAAGVPSADAWVRDTREQLIRQGVMKFIDDRIELSQDYVFSSPSRAAATLIGGNANGLTEWKTAAGVTLKELEQTAVVERGRP